MSLTIKYPGQSGSAGVVNQSLVSDYGVLKKEVASEFYDAYGDQNFVVDLEMMGKEVESDRQEFSHFRAKGKLMIAIQVATTVTGALAGDPVTFTLKNTSHTNAGKRSPLRQYEDVQIKSSGVWGKIVSVNPTVANAHTFVVIPKDDTETFNMTNTDHILLRGNISAGEASDSMVGQDVGIEEVTGSVTEIRDDMQFTDRALMEKMWFKAKGGDTYKYIGMDALTRRFLNFQDGALVLGVPISNANITTNSKGTLGLFPSVDKGGQYVGYAGTNITLDTFHDITRARDISGSAKEFVWLHDTEQGIDVTDGLSTIPQFTNGAINYGSFGGDKEIALSIGYKSFNVDGINYHFKKYDGMNTTSVYGVQGGYLEKTGYLLPMDNGADGKTGKAVPSLAVRYQQVEGQKMIHLEDGALSSKKNGKKLILDVGMVTYKGLQVFDERRFIKVGG
jgi:hypothetical protein